MKKFTYYILLVALCPACTQINETRSSTPTSFKSGWQMVYKHDENGKPLSGSIDSLIAGIRNGYDLRVGWGWKRELGDSTLSIEHMAEPVFLAIVQEKHVSVVIDAHPMPESYVDMGKQKIGEGGHIWQCIITTQGTFNAQVHNRSTGELMKDWPQRHRMTWFLDYPEANRSVNEPLFK